MMTQEVKQINESLFDEKELIVSEEHKSKKKKSLDYEEIMERRLAKKASKRRKNENY